jgi:hypothetical protein
MDFAGNCPSDYDPDTHVIVSSDSGYRLVLIGGAFEASVAADAGTQPPVVVFPGEQGPPYQEGPPYYAAMTYDGSTLSMYVNAAASGDEETFLSTENRETHGSTPFPANIRRQRATTCGSAQALPATRQMSFSLG